jgi:hypothetical protein
MATFADPAAMLRSQGYLALLALAGVLGAPVEFGWAVLIGLAAAGIGPAIALVARGVHSRARSRTLLALPVGGLVVGLLAVGYTQWTGKPTSDVLFSGQTAIGPLIEHTAGYSARALLVLLACKAVAYAVSLGTFRGGPTFPAIFIGAAGGIALSHLPGLSAVAGAAMAMGAMSVVMLTLPLTSVMLATLLLLSDGLAVMPLVIVAVAVAYVASAWISPPQPSSP